jgi:hypothetical protein
MSAHSHKFLGWRFDVPQNTAVFICDHVASGESPILSVSHDNDGDWQFLCDGFHSDEIPILVCLGCAVERDLTVLEVGDLPIGWAAERTAAGSAWRRVRGSESEEAHE